MSTEAVTKLFAGLDLHKRNVFCAIKDHTGQPIYRQRWPAELPTILQALAPYRPHLQAVAVEKLTGPFQRLVTIPGIGNILGITIALETGPIARFASAGQYASYCRTVNSRCTSDGKKKGENNRKNGNQYLAWAYVEAAHFAQRYSPCAQAWFARKVARAGRVVAVKALACKLAKAAYYVLRDAVEFNETKLFG